VTIEMFAHRPRGIEMPDTGQDAAKTELEEAVNEDLEASPEDADEIRGGRAPSPPSNPVPIPYPVHHDRLPD
jgi:hypothetical protein